MRDYYRDMDLATNATPDEIKGQYKRLAKEFHPDRNGSPYAEKRFHEISNAYTVLKDPPKRQEYDLQRQNYYGSSARKEARTSESEFFNSPLWGAVRGFAGNMAQDFVQGLDEEIAEEYAEIDPFVERTAKLTARNNSSGSISLTCVISQKDLREITSLASKGMDIEDYSADVGVLFASALSQEIMKKWRGY